MKKIISIILLVMTFFVSFTTLSSCSPKNDNATIQIWWYDYDNSSGYTEAVKNILAKLDIYCKNNNIAIEIVKYGENTLAYEDYILKRNTAMANGNMIVIDDARNMYDIANLHANYSKIKNYSNIISAYKDRFCIPVGVGYRAIAINNEAIKHYGINMETNVLSNYDYLNIIQQMKEKGAKIKLNPKTLDDTIDYYMIKNGIRYLNVNSEILKDKNDFKAAIKKTIIDIYDDFKMYNNDIKDFSFLKIKEGQAYNYVYDEVSELAIMDFDRYAEYYFLSQYSNFSKLQDNIIGKSFIVDDDNIFNSPCVFLYKKVTNNKIYDVFNEIFTESYYKVINSEHYKLYSPVLDTEKTREYLEVDSNWEHNGILKLADKSNNDEKSLTILKTINDAFKIMAKDKEKSKQLADTYFSNWNFYYEIKSLIQRIINYDVIENNFDYNKKEIDDMINKELDDFIINFYIHYK